MINLQCETSSIPKNSQKDGKSTAAAAEAEDEHTEDKGHISESDQSEQEADTFGTSNDCYDEEEEEQVSLQNKHHQQESDRHPKTHIPIQT